MIELTISEQAEHLSRLRARMLPFLAVLYLAQQGSFFAATPADPDRAFDYVEIGAWVALSLVLLAALTHRRVLVAPHRGSRHDR